MMQDIKKAAPGTRNTRDGAVEAGTERPTTSKTNSTTPTAPGQVVHIADFLSHGPENGVTLHHLEKLTDLPGREVRRMIERERRAGALIISDNRCGYWLADDPAEAQRFARSMLHRSREIAKTARAVELAAMKGAG